MTNWKTKVVYQIWPRSFCDSNGDGVGDLQGIISKLDYLQNIGIDIIWLSPIYLSSNKDYGYDISDYYEINPEFGTMDDVDELIMEAKKRNIEIIMDLVANHTSDEHKWFQEAIKDCKSPYRNFYIFKEGKDNEAPNNWMSFFGGSAWTYDKTSEEYYLTQFTPNQCDLNWENEEMREEIYRVMKFWLGKGIVGFRMDVINAISKAEGLPDKDPHKKGLQFPGELTLNRSKTHEYLQEMYEKVLSNYDCMAIGEGVLATEKDVILYTNPNRHELQMMFQFDLHNLGNGELGKYDFRKLYKWTVKEFKEVLFKWQETIEDGEGWLGNYLSNHDQRRQVSRFGDDKRYRIESAKALCLLNFTLRGTPFMYQGEEIGMTDCVLEEEEWRDYEALNAHKVLQTMMHLPKGVAKQIVKKVSRDNSRTPMQWSSNHNGGFTKGEPWIKVNPNYKVINVEQELQKPNGILSFYKEVIRLYKECITLREGKFKPILKEHKQVISYIREHEEGNYLIIINLTKKLAKVKWNEIEDIRQKQIEEIICNYNDRPSKQDEQLRLRPFESIMYRIGKE
nr:alpha-glucosidase [uncultured Niameybacter sp.]